MHFIEIKNNNIRKENLFGKFNLSNFFFEISGTKCGKQKKLHTSTSGVPFSDNFFPSLLKDTLNQHIFKFPSNKMAKETL